MQEYLRAELVALARRPDPEELFERIRRRKSVSDARLRADEILAHIEADRR